jgi:hypothetical protein
VAVDRLRPHTRYVVDGAMESTVLSDDTGRALVRLELDGRREVRVRPE